MYAVVARSTFPSQNVQSTPFLDHFWKLRCPKSARSCGRRMLAKRQFGGKSAGKIWCYINYRERDVDKNHASPIAPSAEATPTNPMNKTRNQANMIGWHVVFNYPFAGGAKAALAQRTLVLSRQSALVFGCHHCPSKNKAYFCQK